MKTEAPRNRIAYGQKIWDATVLSRPHDARRILASHRSKV